MAQNISLMGADYSAVPAVDLPKTSGGLARFTDTSASTCSASNMTYGTIGYDANGNPVTGSIIDGDLISYGTEEKMPTIYERVEYIIGRGKGANFDTGVAGNDDTLELELCYEFDAWAAYRGYFGNYTNESSNCWRLILRNTENGGFYGCTNRRASNSAPITFGETSDLITNKKIYVDAKRGDMTVTINGTSKWTAGGSTVGTENATTICIGNVTNAPGSADTATGTAKWYYVKIRSNGDLVRWYVPCYRKSDNAAGFYDMVNHTFNTSDGKVPFELAS